MAPIFAVAVAVLIPLTGSVVDLGRVNTASSHLQDGIDAAVLAGAKANNSSATATTFFNTTSAQSEATVSSLSFKSNGDGSFTGTVQANVQPYFLSLFHIASVPLTATATAAGTSVAGPPLCVLMLDPSRTFTVNSGPNVQASTCEFDILSKGSPAMMWNSGATLNTADLCIAGASVTLNNPTPPPNMQKSCAAASNPFVGMLPAPPAQACQNYNQNPTGGTLNPGVYCSGMNLNLNGATMVLNPGLYIIKGGNWNVNGGVFKGAGVTFYFADTSYIQFNSGTTINLSAPTSGTYNGILFYEPDGLAQSNIPIDDSNGAVFNGLIYWPSRNLTFNSGSQAHSNSIEMIVNSLILDNSTWNISPLASANPWSFARTSSGSGVRLIR